MNLFSINDLIATAPALVLVTGAILILLLQIVLPKFRLQAAYGVAIAATAAAILLLVTGIPTSWQAAGATVQILPPIGTPVPLTEAFNRHVLFSGFVSEFSLLILIALLLLLLNSRRLLAELDLNLVEAYLMMLFSAAGLLYFIAAQDLITLFVALELSSLPLFVLAGWDRHSKSSNEAGIKYFLLSVLATTFLLLGIAFLYGASEGRTNLNELFYSLSRQPQSVRFAPFLFGILGWIFIYAAIAFKTALVPFHGWVADVYEGSITFVTSFMASLIKIAAVAVFFKLVMNTPENHRAIVQPVLMVFAVGSMFYGNLTALVQTNLKRMFAFSSIAHAGYMATLFIFPVGSALLAEIQKEASAALFFYVAGYAATTILVFTVIAFLETGDGEKRRITLEDLKGLGKRNPLAAFLLSLGALSFAGIPPLVGFFGKLYILRVLLGSGQYILALFVAINSLLAVYYYARIVFHCYWDYETEGEKLTGSALRSPAAWISGMALAVTVIGLGLVSSPVLRYALDAMVRFR